MISSLAVLRMLVVSVGDQVLNPGESLQHAVDLVWAHPQVRAEVVDLMQVRAEGIDHLHQPIPDRPDVPLQIHARYTRIEILAAMGEGTSARTPQWHEGVYHAKAARADLLAFTLDKTSGDFSPTTRYRDYAISPELIHWESQSATTQDSPDRAALPSHARLDHKILLFARARADERAFWFLGPATYVTHEGEQPMAVTWKLHTPLPGDLFRPSQPPSHDDYDARKDRRQTAGCIPGR
jgi:hypothetical protein